MAEVFSGILQSIGTVLSYSWWFWLALVIFPIFESTLLFWRQEHFKHELDWALLEIRIPREIKRNPKAMEQVLAAIHALRNSPDDIQEKYIDGEITRWYTFEIVSFGGEIHFYMRVFRMQRDIIEAAFFSYYPDVEIIEVDDYVSRLPTSAGEMFQNGYDLWGSEMKLAREAAYPIKSYLDFESPDEDKQYDPISLTVELLGKAKKEEFVGIQFVISPASNDWKEEFEGLIDELRSKHTKGSHKATAKMKVEFPHILPVFPVEAGEAGEDGENAIVRSYLRTPGETDVLERVEENLSKSAFETVVRFIYISPKELYYDTYPRRGILGSFNQYGSLDLNYFKRNDTTSTRTKIWEKPYIFPKTRLKYRKQKILIDYRARQVPEETFMGMLLTSHLFHWNFGSKPFLLSTRSLATLFHPPTFQVLTGPLVKRVESRKMGPPAGLAIYGEEEEIEKYQ